MGDEQEAADLRLPQKDVDGFLDLTKFEQPRFKFVITELKNGEPTGNVLKFRLDYHAIGLALQQSIPTALMPTGEFEDVPDPNDPDKKIQIPILGMAKIYQCLKNPKEKLPESLPSMDHVLKALESAFQLPNYVGVQVKMTLLMAYMDEMRHRVALKKGTVGSPASRVSIPESSTSKPSAQTPSPA